MPPHLTRTRTKTLLLRTALLTSLLSGCDEQATEIAREAADRQARQNEVMADLQGEVARGTRRLAEADAQSRQEFLGIHHDLQAERGRLDSAWQDVEQQRQQLAGHRRTESLLVPLFQSAGVVLLAALVLGFSWYALVAAHRHDTSEGELNELLLGEFISDEPRLLSEDREQLSRPALPRLDRPPDERTDS